MILDTTYTNKSHNELINDLVGRPFTLLEVFRMKGVGSKRMMIEEASAGLKPYINDISDITYANLELRPNGILVKINKGLQNFTWAIPYYHLVIYKTEGISIHAHGRYIRFKNNINLRENKSFFRKMNHRKLEFDSQYQLIEF